MTLDEFEARLADLIGKPSTSRPFVCEGSPLDCEIFIVGFNPATEGTDFWQFWRPGQGFDKASWFEAYKGERARRPLQPDKTRRLAVSRSRRVLDMIVEASRPLKVLETNIFATPTERASELKALHRDSRPFEFLMEAIRPRLVVTHGKDAAAHLQTIDTTATVENVAHFARRWSDENARRLGGRLVELMGPTG